MLHPEVSLCATRFDDSMNKLCDDVASHNSAITLSPTPIKVLTMTATVNTNMASADAQTIKSFLTSDAKTDIILRPAKVLKKKSSKIRSSFQNSVALQYMGGGTKKCIKIFRNARVHVTGLRSGVDVIQTVTATSELLSQISHQKVDIPSFAINMLNLQFYAGISLDLPEIKTVADSLSIRDRKICSVAYDRYIKI